VATTCFEESFTHRFYVLVVVAEVELDRRRCHCSVQCTTDMPGVKQVSNSLRCNKSIGRRHGSS
jgi:hypothetical protein